MMVRISPICWVDRDGCDIPLESQTYYVNTESIAVFEIDENKDDAYEKTGHIHLVNGDVIFIVNASCDAVLDVMGVND